MVRAKLTAKRIPRVPDWLISRRILGKRERPYKIKMLLPEQKQVNIKKNSEIVKTITVRRKSTYFNDRWARTL